MAIDKLELDIRVAEALEVSREKIHHITAQFVEQIRGALVSDGEVIIAGLGRFTVKRMMGPSANLKKGMFKEGVSAGTTRVENPEHIRVVFRKGQVLRQALKKGTQHGTRQ